MYLSYYGLKELPFSVTPDPRYLYFSPHHLEAYTHMIYGIEHRKGFIEALASLAAKLEALENAAAGIAEPEPQRAQKRMKRAS